MAVVTARRCICRTPWRRPAASRRSRSRASQPTNAATTNVPNEAQKPRESATRLDPQPLLPDIKVDKDTSMGFGHGGIIGLERKF